MMDLKDIGDNIKKGIVLYQNRGTWKGGVEPTDYMS